MYQAGTAFITIMPSLTGMQRNIRRQLGAQTAGVGAVAGRRIGANIGEGVSRGVTPAMGRVRTSVGRTLGSVGGLVPVLGRVRDGFRSSGAAASAFSGHAGTAGGALRRATDRVAPMGHALSRVRDGFRNSGAAASAFTGYAGTAGGAARRVTDRVGGAGRALGRFRDGFRSSGAAASAFSGSMGTLGGYTRRATDGVRSFTGRLTGAAGGMAAAGAGASAMGQRSRRGIMGGLVTPTRVATVAIGGMGVALVGAGARIEQTESTLTGLYGSAEIAGDMMDRIRDISRDSPIEHAAYSQTAETLAYMGFEGEQAADIMTAVGDSVVAVGGTSEHMDRVSHAMLNMINVGQVQLDQLNQISQAGVPVFDALADHMGMSIAEVREAVSEGGVEIEDVMTAIETRSGDVFTQMTQAAEENKNTLSGQWAIARDNVVTSIGEMAQPLVSRLAPAIGTAGERLGTFAQSIPTALGRLREIMDQHGVTDAFRTMGETLRTIASVIGPHVRTFFVAFGVTLGVVVLALEPLFWVLGQVGALFERFPWLLTPIVAALGVMAGVVATITVAKKLWAVATGIATIAQRGLNTAMRANPIGMIIMAVSGLVAGIIYLAKNTQFFQTIWAALSTAFQWAWENVIQPVWEGMKAAWDAIVTAISWAWENIIQPVWEGITTAISWAWENVIQPVWEALKAGWDMVVTAMQWAWENIIQPVWSGIQTAISIAWSIIGPIIGLVIGIFAALGLAAMAMWEHWIKPAWDSIQSGISWAWETVISPIADAIMWAWDKVSDAAMWLWENAIKPAWDAISSAIEWAWEKIIEPAMVELQARWDAVSDAAMWLWEKVIQPAWDGISSAIEWAWENVILPAMLELQARWDAVSDAASWLWDKIESAWDGIGSAISWVYENIIEPVIDRFQSAVETVQGAWETFRDKISDILRGVGNAVRGPIQAVIDVVWNDGLRELIQKGADLVSRIPGIPEIPVPGKITLPTFGEGGEVTDGPAGRDKVLAWLTKGEGVLVPELMAIIGSDRLDAANRWARSGADGFARGGTVGSSRTGRRGGGDRGGQVTAVFDVGDGRAGLDDLDDALHTLSGTVDATAQPALHRMRDEMSGPSVHAARHLGDVTTDTHQQMGGSWSALAESQHQGAHAMRQQQQLLQEHGQGSMAALRSSTWAEHDSMNTSQTAMQHHGQASWAALRSSTWAEHDSMNDSQHRMQQFTGASWNHMTAQSNANREAMGRSMLGHQRYMTDRSDGMHRSLRDDQDRTNRFAESSWSYIRDVTSARVDAVRRILENLERGLSSTRSALTHTAEWAEWAFRRVREGAAAPIRWTLRNPINRGIIAAWRQLNRDFDFGTPVSRVPVEFATGGLVPGVGDRDTVDAKLTPGEYVVPKRTVRRVGVDHLREMDYGRLGGPETGAPSGGGRPGGGGAIWQRMWRIIRGEFGRARLTSAVRPGDPGYHGSGRAIDVAGPVRMDTPYMTRINRWVAQAYPNSTQLIYTPGTNLLNGRPHRYNATTRAQHHDHVHWAMAAHRMLNDPRAAVSGGGGMDPRQIVDEAFKEATSMVAEIRTRFPRNQAGRASWGMARKALQEVKKHANEKMLEFGGDPGGSGVQRWAGHVRRALAMLNLPSTLVQTTLRRMNQESGGNPRAINNWDINARRGTPSKGLMQVIRPTFEAYKDSRAPNDIWHPMANILASMRYTLSRYGSLPAGYNRPGGYDEGGVLPPGLTLAYNGTGRDEYVVTQQQMKSLLSGVDHRTAGPTVFQVENVNVQSPSDRFSVRQVIDNLALHGVS